MSDPRELLDTYGEGLDPKGEGDRMEAALRAVLGLHKRDEYGWCLECGIDTCEEPIPWPCDTVQAITTELEAK